MCYGSRCYFEGYMGSCTIYDYKKIRDKYGLDACIIGGVATCEEEMEFIEVNEEKFNVFRKEMVEQKLSWL